MSLLAALTWTCGGARASTGGTPPAPTPASRVCPPAWSGEIMMMIIMIVIMMIPVVIVEDENGSDAARAHHEHDAAKIHA